MFPCPLSSCVVIGPGLPSRRLAFDPHKPQDPPSALCTDVNPEAQRASELELKASMLDSRALALPSTASHCRPMWQGPSSGDIWECLLTEFKTPEPDAAASHSPNSLQDFACHSSPWPTFPSLEPLDPSPIKWSETLWAEMYPCCHCK